ncbi:hypothetical protein [Actinomadura citrea]|uniref:Uncharacterized protein n=1 Tax=Actinomadura citrea TaxID=46158 RepID=A0A7Y9GB10_9ACTN|nr:hypothetical protein [Actinomadura citrea]NYE13198.1 hypothetical protein [Actinomadura citrea]GGU04672.1 hypothetical protein GCM10010177_74930 [Actinomadura citrea]
MTDVADLRKVLDEDKRLTLIVSLLHRARTGVRDDVVTMFCKRLASIHKKGRIQLETLREVHRAESERLLGMFGDVLDGVREAMSTAVPLAPAYAERHNALAEDDGSAGAEAGAESSDGGAGAHSREAMVERAGRLALKALDQAGGLEVLATAHDAVSAHHGNNYLPLLRSDLLPASATGTT